MRITPVALILCLTAAVAPSQTMKAPDIAKEPTLYVVPYAHLDTQWRWEFPQSISEYLLKTLRVNFDYIEKYPHYVFNWTGANRYRLMKEYFPTDYAKMKGYVAKGRWYPAGSSVEEGDVNLPNAEAIIRQILYGNDFFRKEFGKASAEYMLPDCFGFPASLPSILAHAGVKGFSTQKLSSAWQPAPKVGGPDSPEQTPDGIPFNVGIWEGTDGKTVIAALNPESYTSNIRSDLSKSPAAPTAGGRGPREQDWPKRIDINGHLTGVYADYHYIGTGDIGGAVDEESVKLLEAMATKSEAVIPPPGMGRGGRGGQQAQTPPPQPGPPVKMGDGPVHVISATSDQMFKDISPEMTSKMPRYKGDLELINHSAGSLTSEAIHRQWNRRNEILADAAEKASVAANWLGARPYPQERLTNAWWLVMAGHFHDAAGGTATPRSYEFIQNDDVLAMNQFSGVLTSATQGIASGMDTQGGGTPIVVYNPLNVARQDVVEVDIAGGFVHGPDGKSVPSQYGSGKLRFLASVPPVGYAVYDVQTGKSDQILPLHVSEHSLENARYRVAIDPNGDVSSIFDKSLNKELLSAPIRLAISEDSPRQWPAWNMDFDQEQAAPRAYVGGPAQIKVVENGPVRIAVQVTRETEGSKIVQTVRLSAGDAGNRVEFTESIDWKGLSSNVKAVFPLTASNPNATYNWDIGTVQRPNAAERQFEVASHQWVDLTDASGTFGATILTDAKNASDKRDDHTIRLTLIRTPGFRPQATQGGRRPGYSDQLNQDWGHHEITFGIAGHANDWRAGGTDWQAYRLNTPLMAFQTEKHPGALGKSFSLVRVSNPRVRMLALKKAEQSDETIVRLVEMDGKPATNVKVEFAGPVTAAREVNGQELPVGAATMTRGVLETSFSAYQPRTFAVKLGGAPAKLAASKSAAVALKYDVAAASNDDTKTVGGFDAKGNALPAEELPKSITFNDVKFDLAPAATGKPDAVAAKGQTLNLPSGAYNRVYVLAAATGDQQAAFKIGQQSDNVTVEDWGGFIGQWDTRQWKPEPDKITQTFGGNTREIPLRHDWAVSANHATWDLANRGSQNYSPNYPDDFIGMQPGFIKRADVAWFSDHHHTANGLNEPYAYSYLFVYSLPLPAGAKTLTLPDNDKIRVMAISVAQEPAEVKPAAPLY
jgi:alpha-mannosidase